jgi:hypothetical protein
MKKLTPAPPYYGERLDDEEVERIWNDPEELMRWSIEQLDPEPDADAEWHSPYRVFCALVKKDLEGLKRLLAKHPEDAAEAIVLYAEFTFPKRDTGRPESGSTPAGLVHIINLDSAAVDYHQIGMIWQQLLGKRNRTKYPTRYDIAAKHRGVRPNQVKDYLDNPRRYRVALWFRKSTVKNP